MSARAADTSDAAEAPLTELRQNAKAAVAAERWGTARELYQKLLSLAPKDHAAFLGMAESLRRLKDLTGARHILSGALAHYPNDAKLLTELGRVEFFDGRFEAGLKIFEDLTAAGPCSPSVWIGKLRCLRELKRKDDFERAIQSALTALPNNPQILTEVAKLNVELLKYGAAVEMFYTAGKERLVDAVCNTAPEHLEFLAAVISRFGGDQDLLRAVANSYVDLKQDQKAKETFETLLELSPKDEGAIVGLIRALKRLGRFTVAEQFAEKFLDSGVRQPRLTDEYADLLWRNERCEKAIEVLGSPLRVLKLLHRRDREDRERRPEPLLASAVDKYPDDVQLLMQLASEQVAAEKLKEAASSYQRALRVDQSNVDARVQLAALLRRLGRLDDACSVIKEGLNEARSDSNLHAERGEMALQRGDVDGAAKIWVDAMPERISITLHRLLAEGELSLACKLAESAVTAAPDRPYFLVELGRVHMTAGRLEKAADAYGRASTQLVQNKGVMLQTVRLLRAIHDFDRAEKCLQGAFARFGEHDQDLLVESGWIEIGHQRFAKALKIFDAVLSRTHWDSSAWHGKALCLRVRESRKEALKALETALSKTGDTNRGPLQYSGSSDLLRHWSEPTKFDKGQLWSVKGDFLVEQNDLQTALACFTEAAKYADDNIYAHLRIANVLGRLHRRTEAEEKLNALLADGPKANHDLIRWQMAALCLARNDLDGASNMVAAMSDETPVLKPQIQGWLYFERGEYRKAEDEFRTMRAAAPHDEIAMCNLASVLVRQVDELPQRVSDDGSPWYRTVSRLKNTGASGEKLVLDEREKLMLEAERLATMAREIDPSLASAHACLGTIAFKRERFAEAESYFQESIRANEVEGDYTSLGELYLRIGDYDKAESALKKAYELAPMDARPRIALGERYLLCGDIKKAIAMFHEARTRAPHNDRPVRGLARALMKQGDSTEAVQVLNRALQKFDTSKSSQLHLALCRVFTEIADKTDDSDLYSEALHQAEISIRLGRDVVDAHFHAGVVTYKQRDWVKAKQHFRHCGSQHFDAQQNLRRLKSIVGEQQLLSHAGWFIAAFCGLAWLAIACAFLTMKDGPVDRLVMTTLTPVLLGLGVVGVILPYLVLGGKLKLIGLEAELSRPKEQISQGPSGSIDFGSASLGSPESR
jgi:tetratricopeptide (TPR) repeat protein